MSAHDSIRLHQEQKEVLERKKREYEQRLERERQQGEISSDTQSKIFVLTRLLSDTYVSEDSLLADQRGRRDLEDGDVRNAFQIVKKYNDARLDQVMGGTGLPNEAGGDSIPGIRFENLPPNFYDKVQAALNTLPSWGNLNVLLHRRTLLEYVLNQKPILNKERLKKTMQEWIEPRFFRDESFELAWADILRAAGLTEH